MTLCSALSAALRGLLVAVLLLPALGGCARQGVATAPAATVVPAVPAFPPADLAALAPRFSVALFDAGQGLEFRGEITSESAAALRQALAAAPAVTRLSLTSPGGSLGAAIEAANVIALRHLTTVVPLACISACTLLFVAGRERLLAADARLGFHAAAPALPAAAGNPVVTAFGNDVMRQWLLQHGVAVAFLDQVLAVAHDRVWYPSRTQLTRAGVMTGTSRDPAALAAADGDPATLADWVFLNDPLFVGLRAAFPQDYATLRAELLAAFRQGGDDLSIDALAGAGVTAALEKALPVASDAVLLGFFEVMHDTLAAQRDIDPQACRSVLQPGDMLRDLDQRSQLELGDRMARVLALAFFSVARGPAPPVSRALYDIEWTALAQRVWQSGVLRDSDRALLHEPTRDPRRFCTVALAILDAMLASPPAKRAVILRGLVQFP